MATIREIRRRIRGVKNIAQVTRALEAVSAARVRRAQQAVHPGDGLQAGLVLPLGQLQRGPLGVGHQDLAPQGLLPLGQGGVVHGHQDAHHP
ncbi:MAG: hypothetical protein C4336_05925, partial [Armatimonadota bacterium]